MEAHPFFSPSGIFFDRVSGGKKNVGKKRHSKSEVTVYICCLFACRDLTWSVFLQHIL